MNNIEKAIIQIAKEFGCKYISFNMLGDVIGYVEKPEKYIENDGRITWISFGNEVTLASDGYVCAEIHFVTYKGGLYCIESGVEECNVITH